MKKKFIIAVLLCSVKASGQNYILKPGDRFPDLIISPIINAPVTSASIDHDSSNKLFIINFWGTWCSPCIPEMDSLAKLQAKFTSQIQIIGLSDDPVERLRNYLAKKPSGIWLASDTTALLYQMLNLAYVGQCIVIDNKHEILALLKTDSVNAEMISRLLKGERLKSNGEVQNRLNNIEKDAFGVDSLLSGNFTIRGYMKDQQTIGKTPKSGVFGGRRMTYFNVGAVTLYKAAYDITSSKRIVYEGSARKYDNYQDKNLLYCFDLLVRPEDKDRLLVIMQHKLQHNLPVGARIELRDTDVYILKVKEAAKLLIPKSTKKTLSYGFSGRGFDGEGITLTEFTNIYLSNELNLPVVDETGLEGRYDVKTSVDIRTNDGVLKSIGDIGLMVTKARRRIKILVLYTDNVQ